MLPLLLHAGESAGQSTTEAAGQPDERVSITELSRPGDPGKTFVATTAMRAPLPTLCAILKDYARYPQFMPNTAGTDVLQAAEGRALIDMTLSLPLGKIKRYRLQMDAVDGRQKCRLSWKLVPRADLSPDETIADTSGHWLLQPHPAGNGLTRVEYLVYADPGPVPFGLGWIVDIMSRDSLPRTLEALRERAGAQ